MSYNTFRENDMIREQIVCEYLDKKLYNQSIFEKVCRTNSLEDQFAGSDVVLSILHKGISNKIVDEKAQLYYLDGGLPTFAFELNFILGGNCNFLLYFYFIFNSNNIVNIYLSI